MFVVRFKRTNPRATIPSAATESAVGLDLYSAEDVTLASGAWLVVQTGLNIELPPNVEGQVRPRSGMAAKRGITVLNAPGTIDPDYRGPLGVVLINHNPEPQLIKVGDRIAQLVVAPAYEAYPEMVDELSSSSRGEGGFGSTGD